MLIPFTPFMQPDQGLAPIVIASKAKTGQTSIHTIGECQLVDNEPTAGLNGESIPNSTVTFTLESATSYLQKFDHRNNITLDYLSTATVSVIQKPSHGVIVIDNDDPSGNTLLYMPTPGYFGDDFGVTVAKLMGAEVRVFHFFHVIDGPTAKRWDAECGKNGGEWKISSSPSAPTNGSDYSQLHVEALDNFYPNVTINFENLANGLLGETQGQSITLDSTADGYGWFIDPNPLDNAANFLPTVNPAVWIAKPGSAAAGKADLLSVLLYE